jgi:hypothetical protein
MATGSLLGRAWLPTSAGPFFARADADLPFLVEARALRARLAGG